MPQGQEPEKFFVSAGFALTHPSSVTDITAIEAVRVEELDEGAVSCLLLLLDYKRFLLLNVIGLMHRS